MSVMASEPAGELTWLRAAGALTIASARTAGDPLAEGAAAAADLGRTAAALVELHGDGCDHDPCRLAGRPGGAQACDLAADLAAGVPRSPLPAAGHRRGVTDPATRYLRALRESAGAVYYCRRVEHPTGRCWFSAQGPESGLCGKVLAVSHRLAA
jgi:hypothetical protein